MKIFIECPKKTAASKTKQSTTEDTNEKYMFAEPT